jgi:hypothetical protein
MFEYDDVPFVCPNLWVYGGDNVMGRDVCTDQLVVFDESSMSNVCDSAPCRELSKFDASYRVIATGYLRTLVIALVGGEPHVFITNHPSWSTNVENWYTIVVNNREYWASPWSLAANDKGLWCAHWSTNYGHLVERPPYEDDGRYDELGLHGSVVDALPRTIPRFLLLDDGSVYSIEAKKVLGQVQLNRPSRKAPLFRIKTEE